MAEENVANKRISATTRSVGRMYAQRKLFRKACILAERKARWELEKKTARREQRRASLLFRLGKRIDRIPHVVSFFHMATTRAVHMEVYEPSSCRVYNFTITADKLLDTMSMELQGPQQLRYVFSPTSLRCLADRVRAPNPALVRVGVSASTHWGDPLFVSAQHSS